MSLLKIKNNLFQKIQNSNDQLLLNQISEWMNGNESSFELPLNEIQKIKLKNRDMMSKKENSNRRKRFSMA